MTRVQLTAAIVGLGVLVTGCAGAAGTAVVVLDSNTHPMAVAAAAPASTPPTTVATTVPTTVAPTTAPTTTLPPGPQPVAPLAVPLARARQGQNNPNVAALKARLLQLGFWVDGNTSRYTFYTAQAVMAFQKDQGLPRTGRADATTVARLSSARFRVSSKSTTGDLVEIDKAKQILYIVRKGKVEWAVNTSTASGRYYAATGKRTGTRYHEFASTPVGVYHVYRQHPNGWWEGDLGRIYRPKYFDGGRAIHGMTVIPGYPASHGCVRVSTAFMDYVWSANLIPLGVSVWIHDGTGTNPPPPPNAALPAPPPPVAVTTPAPKIPNLPAFPFGN